jgi:Fe-S-cluster-containing dehydrogenase component/anaerobic selenocysteine-containing dehydrogenase
MRGEVAAPGEFPGGLPSPHAPPAEGETRRDFLSAMGFGIVAAGLGACRAPEQKAIPLAVASVDQIPGVANYYATTCGGCASACSLVVKQRDGRPIKVEGNEASPLFGGATCATGQATVLSLYDQERLRCPTWQGKPVPWRQLDEAVVSALAAARASGGGVALLSSTITSPSLLALIERWQREVPGFRHVMYDAVSAGGLRQAGAHAFGQPLIPHYAFDRARVIVGMEADFLGTWLSPVEYARQYAHGRARWRGAGLHLQVEAGMSVTGSNADRRIVIAPSQRNAFATSLLARIAAMAGHAAAAAATPADDVDVTAIDEVAAQLWAHRGESLVVSGCNDVAIDRAVHAINALLGNLGQTVDLERPSRQRQGSDAAMATLVEDMLAGRVHTLILHGVNPVYDYADRAGFVAGLAKVNCALSTADRDDETATLCHGVGPDHHFLEAWGDAEPVSGHLSLSQPTISPLFDTRSAVESLLRWLGDPMDHYQFLRGYWRDHLFPRQLGPSTFEQFWDLTLERGVIDLGARADQPAAAYRDDWEAALAALRAHAPPARELGGLGGKERFELSLVEGVPLRDGRHANNPWLLELPDPITKLTWGNAASLAPRTAARLGLRNGDVVAILTAGGSVELPIFEQPGQHPSTITIALGYGREQAGKAGSHVGTNAFPLAAPAHGERRNWADGVELRRTGKHQALASTQDHFSMEGRAIVLDIAASELGRQPAAAEDLPDLWGERPHGARSWGMSIDLDACTGCSACVVACQAENNVPVVGKDQVQRQRSMHWIRIDRYYVGAEDQPRSVHQPMMCQHCGHAPCETVCPVLATTTSSEGLNQQVYNRCIGTRYCANNCPYKVRRFNWFNYTDNARFDFNMANPIGRLVLNPDVTVRSRGVMEKCSLCVQRIHAAKNQAVKEERPLRDGDIKTACQQACPANAIVFGDLADPSSQVANQMRDQRTYRVLDELGTRPNVAYLKKVRHG